MLDSSRNIWKYHETWHETWQVRYFRQECEMSWVVIFCHAVCHESWRFFFPARNCPSEKSNKTWRHDSWSTCIYLSWIVHEKPRFMTKKKPRRVISLFVFAYQVCRNEDCDQMLSTLGFCCQPSHPGLIHGQRKTTSLGGACFVTYFEVFINSWQNRR